MNFKIEAEVGRYLAKKSQDGPSIIIEVRERSGGL